MSERPAVSASSAGRKGKAPVTTRIQSYSVSLTVPETMIDDLRVAVPADVELPTWSPSEPKLKEVTIKNDAGDRISFRTAKRTIEVQGDKLLLNGKPLQVRGVLNWGYYPPTLEPMPSDIVWRADLKRIKARAEKLAA